MRLRDRRRRARRERKWAIACRVLRLTYLDDSIPDLRDILKAHIARDFHGDHRPPFIPSIPIRLPQGFL
jgi:hypothetical protein